MTELTLDLTLAEIVTTCPSLARQLEAYDLDYCCGGSTTLRAPANILELVDHLEATHHTYLWSELPRLRL